MAIKKYTCPPQSASGSGTFSDDLVGFQLVTGGGLTQGNFQFTTSVTEKTNRTFTTGTFSNPITLDSLGVDSVTQSKLIFENNFKVYPNFDLSEVTNFTIYGSMVKRMSVSVEKIINYFPAAIESTSMGVNYVTGDTATNILYNSVENITSFDLDIARFRNPFDIDFSINSTRNLELREIEVSSLRNMTIEYSKYSLYYNGNGYSLTGIVPTTSLTNGVLTIFVEGNPFSGNTFCLDNLVIRPNDYEVNKVFNEGFDEVEDFLLNRNVVPVYTATFKVPREAEDGTFYTLSENLTWPLNGQWNLDIITGTFNNYLTNLNSISESFDLYKTNLVSRFLTTNSFKEFDTVGQKMEKVLQLYGRSFDETKKFIDALAYMNSVNYNVGNDIPSQLLKNLAQTLGWDTRISPITNDDFLNSVFGGKNSDKSSFSGVGKQSTPDELNHQYYRNLILNSAYLFKSKGTRKSVEVLMRLIGAPEALVEFNEYVYLADQKISMSQFESQYAKISGGTYVQELPVLEPGNLFSIFGQQFTGFTTTSIIKDVNISQEEYPIDSDGYPSSPEDSESYFFQMGSGWYQQTPNHRAPEQVNLTNSVFTGQNPNYQTSLIPYTYGQVYLERYRNFPFMTLGYNLISTIDNNKSWADYEVGLRRNLDANLNALYYTSSDKLVLNVKNVDLFLNPSQGLVYDVWYMSRQYDYPIPNDGLKYVEPTKCNPNPVSNYPQSGGVDWTEINPKPKRKTFFEFAQTFWQNTINVRNRQFMTDGKTSGYPTLQSIYWKYLQSQETINIPNDNFTYQNMINYVNGMGDYWVKLVEQMMPASTIWNTGVKYENSIFHRQKFVWRRQAGCQLVPLPCRPCSLTTNVFHVDCPTQSIECPVYPWETNPLIQQFSGVLGATLNSYLISNGFVLGDCDLNSLSSEWFVDIRIDDSVVIQNSFFNGVGYLDPILSSPSNSLWLSSLINGLDDLKSYGYDYYLTSEDTVVIYNSVCSVSEEGVNIKINVGINFQILCS
jgi:hypothetical protein